MIRAITLLAGLLAALSSQAQTADPASAAQTRPNNAMADAPVVRYQSALDGYRAFQDEKVLSWQASNDNVARIGGWRAYAREAREPAPRDAAPGRNK